MLASGCIDNQYIKSKEKVVINIHFKDVFCVGDTTYAYFSPTAECYGVSAQYRFRCVLGELGRFREKNGFREGSGKVPGTVPGTGSDGFRGLDRFQGSEVWIGSKVPRLG